MSRHRVAAILFFAFFIPGLLLASLQNDTTDRVPPTNQILRNYASGGTGKEVLGAASPLIVNARCLMRGALWLCMRLSGAHLTLCNIVLQTVFTWAALCLIYASAVGMLPTSKACVAVLLTVIYVPWGFLKVGYSVSWPYDLPALFFAAFGLWAILSRRFLWLAVVIAVGSLNKETIVFLIPAYVLSEWPTLPKRTLLIRALGIAALFAFSYETPRLLLQANHSLVVTVSPSDGNIVRWHDNLQHLLLRGDHALVGENVYWAMTLHLVPLLCWRVLPWQLRATYLATLVFIVPVFFFGNIYELRLYNELIPLGAISTVAVLSAKFDQPLTVLPCGPGAASIEDPLPDSSSTSSRPLLKS